MYTIEFYRKKNGECPVLDYMRSLNQENSKDSRINLNKISQYIKVLENMGTRAGEPFMKHLNGDIWELRPIRNRIFFAAVRESSFVLLHHFLKTTQKTPAREIEQAVRELNDYLNRSEE